MKRAHLEKYAIEKDRLVFEVRVLDRLFSTSIWYKDVDLNKLAEKIGHKTLENIVAHIAAFEMNKYGSLHLEEVDLGDLRKYVSPELAKLWGEIFVNVWGQWRFENNLPNEKVPILISNHDYRLQDIDQLQINETKTLNFFSGGKDSYVSCHLLKDAGINFDIIEYSSSIYGNRHEQASVRKNANEFSKNSEVYEMAIFDDFLDSPIVEYDGNQYHIHSLTAAETPASIFETLPIALYKGHTELALGHEKSANYPNLKWELEDDCPINHQWGKSLEAQKLIADYLRKNISSKIKYYSTLMPLSDPAIFSIFALVHWQFQKQAHSCNIEKPWCKRCAKCVYVWIYYLAFLDDKKVCDEIFDGESLFEIKENFDLLRMLAGQESHTPFECVGQPEETRLALFLARTKGYEQQIVFELTKDIDTRELINTANTQLSIDRSFLHQCDLPAKLEKYYIEIIEPQLDQKRQEVISIISNFQVKS